MSIIANGSRRKLTAPRTTVNRCSALILGVERESHPSSRMSPTRRSAGTAGVWFAGSGISIGDNSVRACEPKRIGRVSPYEGSVQPTATSRNQDSGGCDRFSTLQPSSRLTSSASLLNGQLRNSDDRSTCVTCSDFWGQMVMARSKSILTVIAEARRLRRKKESCFEVDCSSSQ